MNSNGRATGWHFCQHFGEKIPIDDVSNVDILSSLVFNEDGRFLAAGDNGGRVVIFQQEGIPDSREDEMVVVSGSKEKSEEYRFFSEFQSHEPEFDYLSSTEIQERINVIRWIPSNSNSLSLLSTNDKTIKLWRLSEKHIGRIPCPLLDGASHSQGKEQHPSTDIVAQNKRVFGHAHSYNIHSLSCFNDGETFISADDLRINLWNLNVSNQSFNILDIKPSNMSNLTEVISSACCHPNHCSLFAYSTSRGVTTFSDLRVASRSTPVRVFQDESKTDPEIADLVSTISSVHFTPGGRYFLTRDFLTVKVWDSFMEREPVQVFSVHESLRQQCVRMSDSDMFFDRFEIGISGDGRSFITGSYQNTFHIMDRVTKSNITIEASRKSQLQLQGRTRRSMEVNVDNPEFGRSITQVAWHPLQDLVALSSLNNLY
ncbi:hypothetical protein WA588_001077, partial [Blastocystis sp. NMH]